MLIGTQIKSFWVPCEIWHHGSSRRKDLPPMAVPARDALEIERRFLKGATLRNESQRYTLCCERIQTIISEVAQDGLLNQPIVFTTDQASNRAEPTVRSYLTLIDTVCMKLRGSPYPRVAAVFFPPDHAERHYAIYEAMQRLKDINELFLQAAKRATLPDEDSAQMMEQCRQAFYKRLEFLRIAASRGEAVVDVVEVILGTYS